MATVAGMAWDIAKRYFLNGYDRYQADGNAQSPWQSRGDKRCGLWVAGKDAARKRIPRDKAWKAFVEREKAVM